MRYLFWSSIGVGILNLDSSYVARWIEWASRLNYLTLVLIGYGLYLLKHLGRVYFTGGGRIFSFDFFCRSLWILGLTLGLPYCLVYF